MKFFVFLIQIAANILSLLIIARILPGIDFSGNWMSLVWFGLLLGVLNYLLKLFLYIVWPKAIFFSLALFTFLFNIPLLILIALTVSGIAISGFFAAFWTVIIIGLTNYSVGAIMHYE
ncbi:MAG: hypothetical protein GF347_01970 [Candidatus Moranbacteria bacterium]|nr:hypothetical protein [Candidatus Moranbacteria bacterium]